MTVTTRDDNAVRALQGLEDGRSSVRLRAAPAVGTAPDPRFVDRLVERCAIAPEFFVRDMLGSALTRHPVAMAAPGLLRAVRSRRSQARSQALHTMRPREGGGLGEVVDTGAHDPLRGTYWA